jgi:regulatory protein
MTADSEDAGPTSDPVEVARAILLRKLTAGPASRQQLADLLARRGIPDEAAEYVLHRFTDVGLIDDAAFAGGWVETRHHGRGLARRALAHELRTKGIVGDTAEAALATLDADAEQEMARTLVRRRIGSVQRLTRDAATRRLVGYLGRKGYGGGLAYSVVAAELDASGIWAKSPGEPGDD